MRKSTKAVGIVTIAYMAVVFLCIVITGIAFMSTGLDGDANNGGETPSENGKSGSDAVIGETVGKIAGGVLEAFIPVIFAVIMIISAILPAVILAVQIAMFVKRTKGKGTPSGAKKAAVVSAVFATLPIIALFWDFGYLPLVAVAVVFFALPCAFHAMSAKDLILMRQNDIADLNDMNAE